MKFTQDTLDSVNERIEEIRLELAELLWEKKILELTIPEVERDEAYS